LKILFVCLGNICRSPLAEGIMRRLVKEQGLDWEIASAGTGPWHVGKAPDARGIQVAQLKGYDISAQRAQLFSSAFFDRYDYIFVMDKDNYKNVMRHVKNDSHRDKVHHFLADFGEVIDPYYHDHLFEPVFNEIEARCRRLLQQLQKSS